MKIRLFRDPNVAGGGGSTNLSIADLISDNNGGGTITPGTGENKDGQNAAAIASQDSNPLPVSNPPAGDASQNGTTTGDDPNRSNPNNPATDPNNPGGTEEGDDNSTDPVEEATNFYGTVDKITGLALKVEYPEGIDPLSPEGVAVRELAIEKATVEKFDKDLRQTLPSAYAYMLHLQAGKSPEDFFSNKAIINSLPEISVIENNVDVQRQVYKQDLISSGRDDEEAEALIESAIKKNTLKDKAVAAHNKITTAQANHIKELETINAQQEADFKDKTEKFKSQVSKVIADEIGIVVPENQREEVQKFILERVIYQGGKFYIDQEVSSENLKLMIESLVFQFKGANFDNILRKKAATIVSNNIRLKMQKDKTPPKNQADIGTVDKNNVPLIAHFK